MKQYCGWFWFAFLWWLMMLNIFPCVYWPFVYLLWRNGSSDPLPCFLLVRILNIYSHNNFQVHNPVLLTIVIRRYTSSLNLIHLVTESLSLGQHSHLFPNLQPCREYLLCLFKLCPMSSNQCLLFSLSSLDARLFYPGNSCYCFNLLYLVSKKSQISPGECNDRGRDEPPGRLLWTLQNSVNHDFCAHTARYFLWSGFS